MKKLFDSIWFLCAMLMLLCFSGCSGGGSEYISVVQNGYLGEYTDMTVQELLSGHYSMMYEEEIWDGGTTDSGKEIVEVKFQNPDDSDAVTIQFTMMDEKFFKVSAFVDPWESIEKETDLLAVLNYIYIEQYALRSQKGIGNSEFELAFIEQLDKISGSAVLYGASADYSGSRGELCALFGKESLDVSVPWLLDNYGLLDMSYYYGTPSSESLNYALEQEYLYNLMAETTAELYWYEDGMTEIYRTTYDDIYIEVTAYCDEHGGVIYYLSYLTTTDTGEVICLEAIPSCSDFFDSASNSQSIMFDLTPYFSDYTGVVEIVSDQIVGYSLWAEIDGCMDTYGEYSPLVVLSE